MRQAQANPVAQRLARAQQLRASGRHAEAAAIAKSVLERQPGNPRALHILGASLLSVGSPISALPHLRKAAKIASNVPPVLFSLSQTLSQLGRLEEAHEPLDRALAANPGDQLCIAAKSDLLISQGRHEDAAALLEPPIAAGAPMPPVVLAFCRIAARLGRQREAIDLIRGSLKNPSIAHANRVLLHFRLGELLDGLGEYEEAFAAYREGNRLHAPPFDSDAHSEAIDRVIASWTREALAAAPRANVRDDRPVFIVGMPRSGTSLVEQILASHLRVTGLGERPDVRRFVFQRARKGPDRVPMFESPDQVTGDMLEELAGSYAEPWAEHPEAARCTDKLPDNFLYLGLISLAFPGARIVHCRRDPLDTCLSCYFQHFGGSCPYIYDLERLGRFYVDYARLMEHWERTLDLPTHTVRYESLVEDPERETRRLVEFAELEWDDACLRFHESARAVNTASNEQVRRPVYRSAIGRHRHYDAHLEPLRRALGAA